MKNIVSSLILREKFQKETGKSIKDGNGNVPYEYMI